MAKKKYDHEFPCSFTGASTMKERRSIGIKLKRSALTPAQACKVLLRGQLEVKIEVDPNAGSDVGGQQTFDPKDTWLLEMTVESASVRFDVDSIATTFSLPKDAIEDGELDKFAFGTGSIRLTRSGDAEKRSPGRPRNEEEDPDGEE